MRRIWPLWGGKAAMPASPPPRRVAPAPVQPAPATDGVVLPEREEPFFNKPQPKESVRPAAEELPSMQEAGSIVTPGAPAPDKERESILARLRAKVQQEPAATPAHAFTPAPELPVVPSMPPVSRAQTPSSDRLHTYSSDFSDRATSKGASTFSVLAAEQDAHGSLSPAQAPARRTSAPLITLIAVLILGGGAAAFGGYYYMSHRSSAPVVQASVPSLVFFDDKKELAGAGPELMQALVDTAAQNIPQGTVLVTYLSESTTTAAGLLSTPAPGGALIDALSLPAPDILLRNIDPVSTVGVIHDGEETRAFFVLRTTSYAGMLAWEPAMAHDLALLYPLYPAAAPPVAPVATTSPSKASTTPIVATPVSSPAQTAFADAVVASHDVRILRDTSRPHPCSCTATPIRRLSSSLGTRTPSSRSWPGSPRRGAL